MAQNERAYANYSTLIYSLLEHMGGPWRPAFVNASTSAPLTGCSTAALHAGGRVSGTAARLRGFSARHYVGARGA